jgi:NAD(P)-dependent dehydrogenase (short-subunit alcohol dehydrogenase family)
MRRSPTRPLSRFASDEPDRTVAKGTIVITGASSGIGRACAVRFAGLGFRVIAGVRNPLAGGTLAALAHGIEPVFLDVTNADTIRSIAETLDGEPLAGLINNAGIATVGPLELLPTDSWRGQFEVNVIGLAAVIRALLPRLRQGKGRIVNIGSIAGRSALPGSAAYDSSKFAVEAITDALRMELHPFGIRVSIIEPGAVATDIWEKSVRELDRLEQLALPDRRELYRRLTSKIREEIITSARKALPAEAVVKRVEHAMTARRPRTRYVVGGDARFWLLLNLLPDTWRDRIILSGLK